MINESNQTTLKFIQRMVDLVPEFEVLERVDLTSALTLEHITGEMDVCPGIAEFKIWTLEKDKDDILIRRGYAARAGLDGLVLIFYEYVMPEGGM